MGEHDLQFALHWFAKERQWRLYTQSGSYYGFKTLEELPRRSCTSISMQRQITACIRPRIPSSYHDISTGKRMMYSKAFEIYDRLIRSRPIHASPAEHQAMVDTIVEAPFDGLFSDKQHIFWAGEPQQHGNFCPGWRQARKFLRGEDIAELPADPLRTDPL